MTENNYIRYRKLKGLGTKILFLINRIFSIDEKLISVSTFEGRGGFGCNPKYVVEELHKRRPDYKFIWFVNDLNKEFPEYVIKKKNTVWERAHWLTKSKVWIDNYRKPYGTIKRKGQFYLNTWHAMIGFKATGLWRGKAFSEIAYMVSKNDSDMVDYFLVDSEWMKEENPKGLVYDGEYLKTGTPRCDSLYGDRSEYKNNVRRKYGISEASKILMFAPTFRETAIDGRRMVYSEVWSIDFERLVNNMEKRFGGKWYIALRLHPQLADKFEGIKGQNLSEIMIDLTGESDLYDVLPGMDAFITDYSSAAMDAACMHIPVILYADDLEEYTRDRGSLTWDFTNDSKVPVYSNKNIVPHFDVKLPFSIAQDNNELEEVILNFDADGYEQDLLKYEDGVGLLFDGKASERVADTIIDVMENRNGKY